MKKIRSLSGQSDRFRAERALGDNQTSWTIALLRPQFEVYIGKLLSCLGFEFLLFWIKRRVPFRGRLIDRFSPLFPGYLFLHPHECDSVRHLTPIRRFIHIAGHEAAVQFSCSVEDLRSRSYQANDRLVLAIDEKLSARFRTGDQLRIFRGVASGFTAIYHHSLDDGRAVVLVDWMGRMVPFTLEEVDLELDVGNTENPPMKKNRFGKEQRMRHRQLASSVP